MPKTAILKLLERIQKLHNPIVVGIDPIWESIPHCFYEEGTPADIKNVGASVTLMKQQVQSIYNFCNEVIDISAPLVPAVKIQIAFFESFGHLGIECFEKICQRAYEKGLFVIADCKRGDISSSAQGYCNYFLADNPLLKVDAITVNPLMGIDTLVPFAQTAFENQKALFILNKTSNPGSGDLQNLKIDKEEVYQKISRMIARLGNDYTCEESGYSIVGNVVGATYPEEAINVRELCPNHFFLIPGMGAQGGKAEDLNKFLDDKQQGILISLSRSLIFAYKNYGQTKEYVTIEQYQTSLKQAITKTLTEIRRVVKSNNDGQRQSSNPE